MKYLIIPIIIFSFKTSLAQENDSINRFAFAILNGNINFSSQYQLNSVLQKYDLLGIPQASVGWGGQFTLMKDWIGFHLILDMNVVNSNTKDLRSVQSFYAGRIGPAFKISLKKKSVLLFSPYYSYSMIYTGIYFHQGVSLSEQVFEDKIGNVISLNRDSHALGLRLTWGPSIWKQKIFFSACYSYDLLPSRYEGIGISQSSSFPSEQLQYFQLSVGVRAF